MEKWHDPTLPLGKRCVEFAKNEMANGVAEDKPNSFTSPRIREYFSICTRLINGKETPIGKTFKAGNWCSAGVSFVLSNSFLEQDGSLPHGYRLGVIEVMSDMQKKGTYRSIDQVRKGLYKIKVGDPVFFDRSNPNNSASSWWRHIGFVYSIGTGGKFVCISGNNGGKWRLSNHDINQASLLGFGDYPNVKVAETSEVVVTTTEIVTTPSFDPVVDASDVDTNTLAPPHDTGKGLGKSNILIELLNTIIRLFTKGK
jgi:hypothetical protein